MGKGKWGEYSDMDSDSEEVPAKKKKLVRKLFNPSNDFLALRNMSESPKSIICEAQKKKGTKELVLKSSPDNTLDESNNEVVNDRENEDMKRNPRKSPNKVASTPKKSV